MPLPPLAHKGRTLFRHRIRLLLHARSAVVLLLIGVTVGVLTGCGGAAVVQRQESCAPGQQAAAGPGTTTGSTTSSGTFAQAADAAVAEGRSQGIEVAVDIADAANPTQAITAGATSQMPSASVIKLAVAIAAGKRIDEGTVTLAQVTPLLNPMISVSSNEATNQLVALLGGRDVVNSQIRALGVSEQEANLGRDLGAQFAGQDPNTLTIGGVAKLLQIIYDSVNNRGNQHISQTSAAPIVAAMRAQTVNTKFGAVVPTDQMAHKTGELTGTSHDVGWFISGQRWLTVAILTNKPGGTDQSAGNEIIKRFAKKVFDARTQPLTGNAGNNSPPSSTESATAVSTSVSASDPASASSAAPTDTTEAPAATPAAADCAPSGNAGALNTTAVPAEFVAPLTEFGAMCAGLSPPLLAAQIKAESNFQRGAVSPSGAMGYTQFMPGTWATYGGGGDPNNPRDAVKAQATYDCALLKIAKEQRSCSDDDAIKVMLAMYNAGPGGVSGCQVPVNGETEIYVPRILGFVAQFTAPGGGLNQETGGGSGPFHYDSSKTPGQNVVLAAASQIGLPYAWGGGGLNGPTKGIHDGGVADENGDYNKTGFDCSGLSRYAIYQGSQGKVVIGRHTSAQLAGGTPVPLDQLQAGDLIVWPEHVAIARGDGKTMIEAQQSGTLIKISPLRTDGAAGRRYVGDGAASQPAA